MSSDKTASLRTVAFLEAVKGLLVLVAAGLMRSFLHTNAQVIAEEVVRHFHLNPARHNPLVFLEAVRDFGNAHLLALSLGAIVYAVIRFAEAWGLWIGKRWAWAFGVISAGLYIPFELVELTKYVTWPGVTVIAVNVVVLGVLWNARKQPRN